MRSVAVGEKLVDDQGQSEGDPVGDTHSEEVDWGESYDYSLKAARHPGAAAREERLLGGLGRQEELQWRPYGQTCSGACGCQDRGS